MYSINAAATNEPLATTRRKHIAEDLASYMNKKTPNSVTVSVKEDDNDDLRRDREQKDPR